METQMVALSELVEDPHNLRMHPEANLSALCASLAEFGQPEPIVVRKADSVVISGNGRLAAMKRLGWSEAKAVIVDWSDAKARAYSLVANRTAETAEWKSYEDVMRAVEELRDDVDLTDMGFDAEQFAQQFDDDAIEKLSMQSDESTSEVVAASDKPKQGRPVQLTKEQREIFEQACKRMHEITGHEYSEGRALELMSAEYLAGA